jgi:hypothetical protein
VQQWSALGQFAGPHMVALVATRAGDWQWTWDDDGCDVLCSCAVGAAWLGTVQQ